MTQQITIPLVTLEQLVGALNEVDQHVDLKRYDTAPNEVLFDVVMAALAAGRAAVYSAERAQERERIANEPTGHLGVRTGPMEWTKPK